MTPPAHAERYKNHCFPGDIVSHGVWLYYRFTLNYRDGQERLLERGIDVSHASMRQMLQLAPVLEEVPEDIGMSGHEESGGHDRKLHQALPLHVGGRDRG